MAIITMVIGVVLIALGLGGYVYIEFTHHTALIPVALGVILVVLGVLARNENMRKHSMHAAMLFALLGFIGSAWRAIPGMVKHISGDELEYPGAPYINFAIALVCALLVALGIKSFVDARRRRKADVSEGADADLPV
jgi:uncharacterized membrane protein